MAGKAIVPFNEASSTFALEGEPSPTNLALAAMDFDQEAEHIAKTPLAIIPAPASKEAPRGAKAGRPNPWFGQTRGSAGPPLALLGISSDAGAGMIANGVLVMCLASWSTSMAASARFAIEASPSRAKVDEASLNGMIALPAMGKAQSCGEEESKKIKNGGEDERVKRGSF